MSTKKKSVSLPAAGLARAVRRTLSQNADPAKASAMQEYMKSDLPFHGIQTPDLRAMCRTLFSRHPLSTAEHWAEAVLQLWREATHREERYVAIELAAAAAYEEYRTLDALPVYEEMIVSGAWWDFVDPIAANLVGELLRRYPRELTRTMRAWAKCDDIWMRRTAILCQLKFKQHTSVRLLYANIEESFDVPNFFLRKAIGWALREYAKTDPVEVRRFVAAHAKELHPLSRREAMKQLDTEVVTASPRRRASSGR